MRKIGIAVLISLLFCSAVSAAVYRLDELPPTVMEKLAGGEGSITLNFAFYRKDARPEHAIKEMKYVVLPPGASVGVHEHQGDEDAYLICSGNGIYIENDGSEHAVSAGDMTICRSGESHGIKNTSGSPLTLFCVISAQR